MKQFNNSSMKRFFINIINYFLQWIYFLSNRCQLLVAVSFIACCQLSTVNCFSQDPQFSQFYAAPLYLNPALTGSTSMGRLVVNGRNQWKKNVNRYDARSVSLDFNIPKWKIGIGFLATRDYAGFDKQGYDLIGIGPSTKLQRQTKLGILGSYILKIDRYWHAKGGVNLSYMFRSYDFSMLTFRDQFGTDGTIFPTQEVAGNEKTRYVDVSAGGFAYSHYTNDKALNYWVGISMNHLTRPNQAFIGTKSVYPIKTTIHTGTKIPIGSVIARKKHDQSINPTLNYKMQGKFDQLDLGIYWHYRPIMFGIWYRGLPGIKKDAENDNHHDAIVFIAGIKEENLLGLENDLILGFSYDLTISKLGSSASGTFEIAVIYEFEVYGYSRKKKPKFKEMVIPCPKL